MNLCGGLLRAQPLLDSNTIGHPLDVMDSGMGMTPEDSARVFRRFFRTESAREAAISGAGLGLSITKAIVEGHGGDISCTSSPGKGSTFTLTLPAEGPSLY